MVRPFLEGPFVISISCRQHFAFNCFVSRARFTGVERGGRGKISESRLTFDQTFNAISYQSLVGSTLDPSSHGKACVTFASECKISHNGIVLARCQAIPWDAT